MQQNTPPSNRLTDKQVEQLQRFNLDVLTAAVRNAAAGKAEQLQPAVREVRAQWLARGEAVPL